MDIFERFVKYLEGLKDEDWNVKVNSKWTVKDVVSHLIGWEEECANVLVNSLKTGKKPWFLKDQDYSEFNKKNVERYKNYTPKKLLEKWKHLTKITENVIKNVGGEDRLLKEKDWLFDDSHYIEHWEQIKKALNKY